MLLPEHTPRLDAGRLVLRGFEARDVQGRRVLGEDPGIVRMFGGTPAFAEHRAMAEERAAAWFGQVSSDPNPLHWAVDLDGRFVGTARLHDLSHADASARYAVGLLDPRILGQGIGQRLTRLVLHYAFAEIGLHRVGLRVLAYNERAIGCYLRCGFVEEGREREAARVADTWHDEVIMGILDRDHGKVAGGAQRDAW